MYQLPLDPSARTTPESVPFAMSHQCFAQRFVSIVVTRRALAQQATQSSLAWFCLVKIHSDCGWFLLHSCPMHLPELSLHHMVTVSPLHHPLIPLIPWPPGEGKKECFGSSVRDPVNSCRITQVAVPVFAMFLQQSGEVWELHRQLW